MYHFFQAHPELLGHQDSQEDQGFQEDQEDQEPWVLQDQLVNLEVQAYQVHLDLLEQQVSWTSNMLLAKNNEYNFETYYTNI